MFLIKKIMSGFFMPLSILLVLFLMGLIMLRTNRTRPAAKKVLVFTFFLLVLLGYGVVSYWPLQKLEGLYPPFDIKSVRPNSIRWVVVLAGSPDETIVRLTEGIRIYRSLPGTKLIMSGGKVVDAAPEPSSSRMARIATGLGVNAHDIVQENISRDTKDEARIVRSMIHETPFVLVTSAYHMPRSIKAFKLAGVAVTPVPAQFSTGGSGGNWVHYLPSSSALHSSSRALHEYLGMLWYRLKG